MAEIETKLDALGLILPAPLQTPPGIVVPFSFRCWGHRVAG
jgi:hypothetical protein